MTNKKDDGLDKLIKDLGLNDTDFIIDEVDPVQMISIAARMMGFDCIALPSDIGMDEIVNVLVIGEKRAVENLNLDNFDIFEDKFSVQESDKDKLN